MRIPQSTFRKYNKCFHEMEAMKKMWMVKRYKTEISADACSAKMGQKLGIETLIAMLENRERPPHLRVQNIKDASVIKERKKTCGKKRKATQLFQLAYKLRRRCILE